MAKTPKKNVTMDKLKSIAKDVNKKSAKAFANKSLNKIAAKKKK